LARASRPADHAGEESLSPPLLNVPLSDSKG